EPGTTSDNGVVRRPVNRLSGFDAACIDVSQRSARSRRRSARRRGALDPSSVVAPPTTDRARFSRTRASADDPRDRDPRDPFIEGLELPTGLEREIVVDGNDRYE